ncbi:endonuclease domain-containing protein [Micromonospora chokoriensis]
MVHCHSTRAIRGLLCNGCNSILGHFRSSRRTGW